MKDYNNNNIVTGLKVEFKRNMKVYIKVLYIFMTENMIKNIKLEGKTNISQIQLIIVSSHNTKP